MGLFDRFRRGSADPDGRTVATAFVLPPVDLGAAIAARYRTLDRLYGVRDLDWQILSRSRSRSAGGRDIERFVIGTRDSSEPVHFDVTAVVESPEDVAARAAVARAVDPAREEDLTVSLPRDGYAILWKIIEDVGDRFASGEFAYDFVRVTLLQAMAAHDMRSDRPLQVTLRAMDWAALRALAGSLETKDARMQELVGGLIGHLDARLALAAGAD